MASRFLFNYILLKLLLLTFLLLPSTKAHTAAFGCTGYNNQCYYEGTSPNIFSIVMPGVGQTDINSVPAPASIGIDSTSPAPAPNLGNLSIETTPNNPLQYYNNVTTLFTSPASGCNSGPFYYLNSLSQWIPTYVDSNSNTQQLSNLFYVCQFVLNFI